MDDQLMYDQFMDDQRDPVYTAVLFTDVPTSLNVSSDAWEKALRTLSVLAETAPGYEGYEVFDGEGGSPYAVTYWESPKSIKNWKRCAFLLLDPAPWISHLFGQEGCRWPWMAQDTLAPSLHRGHLNIA